MNKFVIACVMCLASASMASAGYTDSLWNESEERVYYDCGDWSGVDNHKDLTLKEYGWRIGDEGWRNPEKFGIQSDVKFVAASNPHTGGLYDNIGWIFLHVNGFDKTLNHNGCVYTDDPTKINYIQGYLKVNGFDNPPDWTAFRVWSNVSNNIDETLYAQKTTICAEYKAVDCDIGGCEYFYKTCCDPLSEKIEYKKFGDANSIIETGLINHSNYMILNVQTPENTTGIQIIAESKNTTAIYEKHTHCLKLNTSESFMTCDLVGCKYHNFAEIIPFGPDSYLLQYEPDYDINVTLYTPFNTIDAVVTLNETDAEPTNTDLKYDTVWDLLYIAVPISMIIGLTRLI